MQPLSGSSYVRHRRPQSASVAYLGSGGASAVRADHRRTVSDDVRQKGRIRLSHAGFVRRRQAGSGYRMGLQAGGHRFDPGTLHNYSKPRADFGLTVDRLQARHESGDASCGGFAGVCNDDPGSLKCRGVSGRPPHFDVQAVLDGSPGIGDGGRRVAREQRVPRLDERAFARRVEDEVPSPSPEDAAAARP